MFLMLKRPLELSPPEIGEKTKKNTKLRVEGRHDPCVVPRAPPVVDSIVSLVIADQALQGGFIKPVI